jgi:outer membrane protein assembly factor BamD (BamD/ComL family)
MAQPVRLQHKILKKALMKKISLSALILLAPLSLEAAFSLKDGKFINTKYIATDSLDVHYEAGMKALQKKNWAEATKQFRMVTGSYSQTSTGQEAYFYLAYSLYQQGEVEDANNSITDYLQTKNQPQHFEEAMQLKLDCAEAYRNGAKRRILGSNQLPKWLSGRDHSLEIYDEVVLAMSNHPMGGYALYGKGDLLKQMKRYRESVECYQQLQRRFPRHACTPDSYVAISKIYLEQSKAEIQNPNLYSLAEMNYNKFLAAFPNDSKHEVMEKDFNDLCEILAKNHLTTAQFFERTNKPEAALLYYQRSVEKYPKTTAAAECQRKVVALNKTKTAAEEKTSRKVVADNKSSKAQQQQQQQTR